MRSITRSGRQPGNEAIGTRVIYSESEEAAASSASMLGTPMREVYICSVTFTSQLTLCVGHTTYDNTKNLSNLKNGKLKSLYDNIPFILSAF